MLTRSNKDVFVRGFAKALEEKWQVDVQLKGRDSDEGIKVRGVKENTGTRRVQSSISTGRGSKTVSTERPKGRGRWTHSKFRKENDHGKAQEKNTKNPKTFCCRGHYVMLKRSCETVTFSELKHEELEALVKFIYSDGSKLSAKAKEHVRSLYVTADKYEIPHLRDLCRNELVKSLNLSNALEVLELSLIPLDNALHDAAFSYIIKNLKTIVNSLEFKLFANRNTDLTVEIIRAFMARRNIYY
ncbi:hypothetical protein F2Q69_00017032 [Brassica cretica]|uniref:BTB domain-containing protein n=1 Tax=Brassica cretica TaxID=69181 RepID=A0A8S9R974_BRACR|nr:hypothetical protein F2Q69_00017032 [Brassica cretica]